jgi:hypothetical protein
VTDDGIEGIVGCVDTEASVEDHEILARCRAVLPVHMVPHGILRIDRMPLNEHGKIDHAQLGAHVAAAARRRGGE